MEQTHHYIKLPSKHRLHYAHFDKTVEGYLALCLEIVRCNRILSAESNAIYTAIRDAAGLAQEEINDMYQLLQYPECGNICVVYFIVCSAL